MRVLPILAAACALALPAAAQNLLVNGGFDSTISGWARAGGEVSAWSALDANGAAGSGSASVTNTFSVANVSTGIGQCVPATPGQSYRLAGSVRVPSGQARTGGAMIYLDFSSDASCAVGHFLTDGRLILSGGTGQGRFDTWLPVSGTATAPAGARAAFIACDAMKAEAGGSFQTLFDGLSFSVASTPLPKTLTIASTASIHGQSQTFFHTDLWVKNRSYGKPVTVTLTYRCQTGLGCDGAATTLELDPRETAMLEDVVAGALGRPESAGAIELTWDSAVASISATSRTYTPTVEQPTTGTSVPASEASGATTRAVFLGLGHCGADRTRGFRSNAGAYNAGAASATVTFRLVDASGAVLGQTTRTAEPRRPFQINDVFAAVGAGSRVTRNAALEITSTAPVFPFVTVIDNRSGDSVWVQASADEAP
jgi:hypothetical protein